jgi:mycothiol synthase
MTTASGPGLTVRPPRETDIPSILRLIAASDIALNGEADPWSEEDISRDWVGVDLDHDGWVVMTPDGTLAGYAVLLERARGDGYERFECDGYVHPAHTGKGIGSELLRLLEARAREQAADAPEGTRSVLHSGTLANDTAARRLMEVRGFTPVRHFWRMRIDMTDSPPAPVWPAGIAVRECVRGQDERAVFETLDEAFQDHWGHTPENYDEWRERAVNLESFDPSLWFLALEGADPAGAIRGRVMADGSGWVNTLGVRRPWRKHGLGSALLLRAFGAFYRRGINSVALGVDAQNPTGATRVYEAAGMHVVREFVVYEKELRKNPL